jgi:hypothetical protein
MSLLACRLALVHFGYNDPHVVLAEVLLETPFFQLVFPFSGTR